MPNNQQLAQFKLQLQTLHKTLLEDNKAAESSRQIVELDQSSVGRLSRMDAMQGQAMAQENERRRLQKIALIKTALKKIEMDDYGYCESCDEEIALKRLEFDPTSAFCIECANQQENN